MKHRTSSFVAAGLAAALVVVLVLWVRGYRGADAFGSPFAGVSLVSYEGYFSLQWHRSDNRLLIRDLRGPFGRHQFFVGHFVWEWLAAAEAAQLGYRDGMIIDWYLALHDWFCALAIATPLSWIVVRNLLRARRRTDGVCVKCGYDLRATPERCPECGTVPASGKPRHSDAGAFGSG